MSNTVSPLPVTLPPAPTSDIDWLKLEANSLTDTAAKLVNLKTQVSNLVLQTKARWEPIAAWQGDDSPSQIESTTNDALLPLMTKLIDEAAHIQSAAAHIQNSAAGTADATQRQIAALQAQVADLTSQLAAARSGSNGAVQKAPQVQQGMTVAAALTAVGIVAAIGGGIWWLNRQQNHHARQRA
jgi:predicted  nucleic acid-binding Zn-ribbon protein